MGNGHMGTPMNKMTDTTENITSPQLRWRAVINCYPRLCLISEIVQLFDVQCILPHSCHAIETNSRNEAGHLARMNHTVIFAEIKPLSAALWHELKPYQSLKM